MHSKWKIGKKPVGIEEKVDIISQLEKGEWNVDICHNVRITIIMYVQFVTMLTELQNVVSQELKCLFNKTTTVLLEWTIPKTTDVSLIHFYCITNKSIYCTEMYVYC